MHSRLWPLLLVASLLCACSTRAPRDPFEALEGGFASPDGAAFMGYHGPVEQQTGSRGD
ncbi:MAG TPA: hypothetical protein VFE82_18220 [Ramlibacter sp.]|jgi:hypothetical protein|uniref:hypothetical protein n=1 Tax=Ramlibacter sp. TaxID=1917967 RepID=UPI002D5DBA05|nr:hypothetical protein [Ramlibacter sp.]HZY20413.1 hypothetical protein [Ramlibacter sp.]